MKKKTLCLALVLVVCLSICTTAFAMPRQASGTCYFSPSGRSVSFSGYSSSGQIEDVIGVTVILWEKRGSDWHEVDRVGNALRNTDFVDAASSITVDGGHYYKVTGIHESEKNGRVYSVTSETASKWIS